MEEEGATCAVIGVFSRAKLRWNWPAERRQDFAIRPETQDFKGNHQGRGLRMTCRSFVFQHLGGGDRAFRSAACTNPKCQEDVPDAE